MESSTDSESDVSPRWSDTSTMVIVSLYVLLTDSTCYGRQSTIIMSMHAVNSQTLPL